MVTKGYTDAQAMSMGLVTTKVPPEYDGLSSWFEYEDAVLDWDAFTELDKKQRGLALKNRLKLHAADLAVYFSNAVSYTHLTLPTNREV